MEENQTDKPAQDIESVPVFVRPVDRKTKVLLPVVLFLLTVVTTVIAGAMFEGGNPFNNPADALRGIPFSFSLLIILGTHEFGHYAASRRHKVLSTLPYFIPAPPLPPFIGTFGAIIKMKEPITTKKALIDIGAAGPLAGFVVAVIVACVGLLLSKVEPIPPGSNNFFLGDPLILKFLEFVVIGHIPENHSVYLHSVAFAAWIGFFITSLNLLPMGQLDGGHIVYAIIGKRHASFSKAMVAVLVVSGIMSIVFSLYSYIWPGWLLWGLLVTAIGLWHPPVADEDVPMGANRRLVCLVTLIVFVLTFMPAPFYIE